MEPFDPHKNDIHVQSSLEEHNNDILDLLASNELYAYTALGQRAYRYIQEDDVLGVCIAYAIFNIMPWHSVLVYDSVEVSRVVDFFEGRVSQYLDEKATKLGKNKEEIVDGLRQFVLSIYPQPAPPPTLKTYKPRTKKSTKKKKGSS